MRYAHAWVFAAAALIAACGGNTTTAPSTFLDSANGKLSAQNASTLGGGKFSTLNSDPCGDVTYVGPIRLPISVHGTTVYLSWLGADGATRGYELEFERYDVTNVWMFAMHDVVTSPEVKEFLHTEGTYRVRVRGLFCNDQVGGWTDWQVFSTDDTEDHTVVPPPVFCPSSVNGCYPPPPPPPMCAENEHMVDGHCVHNGDGDGDGDGQGDDHGGGHDGDDDHHDGDGGHHDPPPPPPFESYLLCHVEYHKAHGHTPASYSEQQKTIHSQGEANGHANHEFDYVGSCDNRYNVN